MVVLGMNDKRRCLQCGPRQFLHHIVVSPRAMQEHCKRMAEQCETHIPMVKKSRTCYVLDHPLPVQMVLQTMVCRTCRRGQGCGEITPMMTPTWEDMRDAFPGILKGSTERTQVFMSKAFLLNLVLSFYDRLSIRGTRRALAEQYTANCLGFQLGALGLSLLNAIPRTKVLRRFILFALEGFLPSVVRRMQRHQSLYSGTIIRGDCQWTLAQRIAVWNQQQKKWQRPYTALSAWMAVDGSAFKPATPLPKEDISNLLRDLEPVVDTVKENRLQAGLPFEQCVLGAHSTDMYRKHRLRIASFYERKYAEGGINAVAPTPRALAAHAVLPASRVLPRVTGDYLHCVLEFRRLVSTTAPDARNIIHDYEDLQSRLSAEKEPVNPMAWLAPAKLRRAAHELLRCGVYEKTADFERALIENAEHATMLRTFLEQPMCSESSTWKKLFGAYPTRGRVVHLAYVCKAHLHETMEYRQYANVEAFKREAKRIPRWYSQQKQQYRRRTGPLRDGQEVHVHESKSVMTNKVKAHFKRLFHPLKLEGLWEWAEVSKALHAAGIPVLSGTLPVEMFWSTLKSMLPPENTRVTLRWWNVLSPLALLRHNYRAFSNGALPQWTEDDSLLTHRLAAFESICSWLHEDHQHRDHLQDLFDHFEL